MGKVAFNDVVEQISAVPEEEQPQTYSVYNYDESKANKSWAGTLPVKQGLYDPELEKDACGVGFAA
jgi:glutamate synthase (NADPH/NADH)